MFSTSKNKHVAESPYWPTVNSREACSLPAEWRACIGHEF